MLYIYQKTKLSTAQCTLHNCTYPDIANMFTQSSVHQTKCNQTSFREYSNLMGLYINNISPKLRKKKNNKTTIFEVKKPGFFEIVQV